MPFKFVTDFWLPISPTIDFQYHRLLVDDMAYGPGVSVVIQLEPHFVIPTCFVTLPNGS